MVLEHLKVQLRINTAYYIRSEHEEIRNLYLPVLNAILKVKEGVIEF